MKKVIRLSSFLVLMALIPSLAAQPFANRGPGGKDGGPGRGGFFSTRFLERFLQLSESQVEQLEQFKDDLETALEPIREESQVLRSDLATALEADEPSAVLVGELVIALHDLRTQAREARQAFLDSFKEILTDEQLALFEELLARRSSPRPGQSDPDPEDGI